MDCFANSSILKEKVTAIKMLPASTPIIKDSWLGHEFKRLHR
jgi:hypothetical protein